MRPSAVSSKEDKLSQVFHGREILKQAHFEMEKKILAFTFLALLN